MLTISPLGQTLSPYKTYKIRYRITGIFEVFGTSTADFIEGLQRTIRDLSAYDIRPIDSGISYDPKNMIVSVFIKTSRPLDLSLFNEIFRRNMRDIWGRFATWVQRMDLRFIDYQIISYQQARTEIKGGIDWFKVAILALLVTGLGYLVYELKH